MRLKLDLMLKLLEFVVNNEKNATTKGNCQINSSSNTSSRSLKKRRSPRFLTQSIDSAEGSKPMTSIFLGLSLENDPDST